MSSICAGHEKPAQSASKEVYPPPLQLPHLGTGSDTACQTSSNAEAAAFAAPMAWPPSGTQQFPMWASLMLSSQSALPADGSASDADLADMAAEMVNTAPAFTRPQHRGSSPMFLQPGDMEEDLQTDAPQGFHLGGASPQRLQWASSPALAAAAGSWMDTSSAQQAEQQAPLSRSCSGAFVDARSRLSQDSCAAESPHGASPHGASPHAEQALPPAASQPDLAAAAMPPPAPLRRARSVPPRSPAASGGTPVKASGTPKGGGGKPAKSSKAAKGGKPAGATSKGSGGGTKGGGVAKAAGGCPAKGGGGKTGGKFSSRPGSSGAGGGGGGRRTGRWSHATLDELRVAQHQFATARDWEKFHTPRNLIMALTGEVGELNEIFQWRGEVAPGLPDFTLAERQHVGEEISDVLLYLVRLADVCGLDLAACVHQKITKNGEKYRAEQCYGSSAKYTAYAATDAAADGVKQEAAAGIALPMAGSTGRRSNRRPAFSSASKRRASAPAGHQQPQQQLPAASPQLLTPLPPPLPPLPSPAVFSSSAQPMDLGAEAAGAHTHPGSSPGAAQQSQPAQQAWPQPGSPQSASPCVAHPAATDLAGNPGAADARAASLAGQQHLLFAAAGQQQPTPPVTPAAVEGLSPARSPIPGVPTLGFGGVCTTHDGGGDIGGGSNGGGGLIPGVDRVARWPPGAGWSALRSLRTGDAGSARGAFVGGDAGRFLGGGGSGGGNFGDCKDGQSGDGGGGGSSGGIPGLPSSGGSAPPGSLCYSNDGGGGGFGIDSGGGHQHRMMPSMPLSAPATAMLGSRGPPGAGISPKPFPPDPARQDIWQGNGAAKLSSPSAAAGASPAETPTSMPTPASLSPPGGCGGSKALTAANIEWLRHADPVELLSCGLGE